MTRAGGRRGSRSDSPPTRAGSAAVVGELPPPPPVAVALPAAPPPHPGRAWIGSAGRLAAGLLLAGLALAALRLEPIGAALGAVLLGAVAALWSFRRPRAKPGGRAPTPEPPSRLPETDLDRGVRDIRRTDRGFEAARFAGYAAMMFRDVQRADAARDASALRDRVTPAMYCELEARGDRLRTSGRSARVAAVDVTSEVTEAWQDGDCDYVTACVAGSMRRHTVDAATGRVVDGSPAVPVPVEAFLTFTRPAGLNFWMLSLIQEA